MTGNRHSPPSYFSFAVPNLRQGQERAQASERYLTVSDKMSLRLIEFRPLPTEDSTRPWLLFLPGWLSQPGNWGEFLSEITPHYRVLYLESREKRSSVPPMVDKVEYSVTRMLADVQEAVELLIPTGQTWLLAGSSLGSSVALEYLAAGKRCPIEAVLIAPNLHFALPTWSRSIFRWFPARLYPTLAAVIKAYIRWFKVDMQREPEQYQKYADTVDAADPRKLRPNALSLFDYDGWPAAKALATPTTLIGGKSDGMHGLDELRQITELNSHCTLVEMDSNKATHSAAAGLLLRRKMDEVAAIAANNQEPQHG